MNRECRNCASAKLINHGGIGPRARTNVDCRVSGQPEPADGGCHHWHPYTAMEPVGAKVESGVAMTVCFELTERIKKLEDETASASVVRQNGENTDRLFKWSDDVAERLKALEGAAAKKPERPCDDCVHAKPGGDPNAFVFCDVKCVLVRGVNYCESRRRR